jgi:hypothetical protein
MVVGTVVAACAAALASATPPPPDDAVFPEEPLSLEDEPHAAMTRLIEVTATAARVREVSRRDRRRPSAISGRW